VLGQAVAQPPASPANQDTPAKPPKELREIHDDGSERA